MAGSQPLRHADQGRALGAAPWSCPWRRLNAGPSDSSMPPDCVQVFGRDRSR